MLQDSATGESVGFATVSLTRQGADKVFKYVLSSENGSVNFEGVRSGSFTLKAELMGYKTLSLEVKMEGKSKDLGVLKMDQDATQLDAAKVTDVGNSIIVKKDTIEYNASSFKTTDNDMLEDLLKKLPGVEIGDDGSISVNGQTISKITIDGKTFFLDDPQLASKNLPAKMINKLKVVNKKSEQAEFTGIDDGEEETVIDLSVKPGMMKGAFGNVMAGAGHDVPASPSVAGDFRYQGAGFVGNFTKNRQLSVILNANNTNNRGFNDLSGSMMGNMRGGGRGGYGSGNTGITTSYMAGVNGAWTLLDNKMELGGNYLYNRTERDVQSSESKTTYLDGYNLLYDTKSSNLTVSNGHRFGVRLDHKFSQNTSLLFEPRIEFGNGSFSEKNDYTTYTDRLNGSAKELTNKGNSSDAGVNNNFSTSGFALLRQRLGIPGRTLAVMGRYSISRNNLNSVNMSDTRTYEGGVEKDSLINQSVDRKSRSYSLMGRATYTEPWGNHFYTEVHYRYSWSRSESEKNTFDNIAKKADYTYSNEVVNQSNRQEIGVNFMYQKEKSRAQVGFSAMPERTFNSTTRFNSLTGSYSPKTYEDFRWRFAPSAMAWWEFSQNANARLFYRGSSNQPSTSQLMPTPDNTDPLNVSFGNPSLKPYFSHNVNGDIRYNNRKSFASFNIRFYASYDQDPIVSATWYDKGAAYSMPMNGPDKASASVNGFFNIPIAKSNFSVNNFVRASWNKSTSYVGKNIDMSTYTTGGDYYGFMEELLSNCKDAAYFDAHFTPSTIQTVGVTDRLRVTYRSDNLELTASGRMRYNQSWYDISSTSKNTRTFNNQVNLGVNWTWEQAGITLKADGNYNWYRGYTTPQPSEYVLNAEIQKLLFKNRFTLAVKAYDILGQEKNITVTDASNYHREAYTNVLGRYIIASLTYRFGTFDRSRMNGGHGGYGGRGGYRPMR